MIYAYGAVGSEPTIVQTSDPADLPQLAAGEVLIELTSLPQGRKVIAADRTLTPFVYPIEYMREWFWAQAKKVREAQIAGGCDTTCGLVDSDDVSIARIGIAAQAAAGDPGFSIEWVLANNTMVTLNAEQMLSVQRQVAQHIADCQAESQILRVAIMAAMTQEELEAIPI
jgi:hypothetical protein